MYPSLPTWEALRLVGFNSFCEEWLISFLIYNITKEGQRLGVEYVFIVSSQTAELIKWLAHGSVPSTSDAAS